MDCMVQAKRIEIRLRPEIVAAVDAWRRHLPDIPPRAEAIVRLIETGLETVADRKAKRETKK
jgi:hypothetical protein